MGTTGIMLPSRVSIAAAVMIAGNAGLAWLYFAQDLTLYQLVIIYWLECLWIGLFSALQLITACVIGNPWENRYVTVSVGGGLFLALLAILYLGGAFLAFAGGLGLAVFLIPAELAGTDPFDLLQEGIGAIVVGAVMLSIGHALAFLVNFLMLGDYRKATAGDLLSWPFRRCAVLLVAILVALGAGVLLPRLAEKTAFAIILILLKLAADYRAAHRTQLPLT